MSEPAAEVLPPVRRIPDMPPRAVVAAVHWARASVQREEIAAGMDRLVRAILPYCRHPGIETLTTSAPFDETRWRRAGRRLAAGRLGALEVADHTSLNVSWYGKRNADGVMLAVNWPEARIVKRQAYPWAHIDLFDLQEVQQALVAAVSDLFAHLHPVYGFINLLDHRVGLYSIPWDATDRERELFLIAFHEVMIERPETVTEFARGVFWANFLGAEHVRKLGGVEAVVVSAPCFRAERLGPDAVLLQATESLPAVLPRDLDALTEFLAPILPSRQDLGYSPEQPVPKPPRTLPIRPGQPLQFGPEPEPLPPQHVAPYVPSFPVMDRGRNKLNTDPEVSTTYGFDSVGNRLSMTRGSTTAYAYDRADRILAAG
ncbi:MAG TPA: hypothetical protein VFC51_08010, partial [Chloroflexota bacterium]|nr:hypothetical protein [Chloroflexota bacterium]